jgi:dihydroneopterin aldolase
MSKIEALHRFPKGNQVSAEASTGQRHVFIRDLILEAAIGAYETEKGSTQRIRINVYLALAETGINHSDQLENVVCYDSIVAGIKSILAVGHINLVETLAENIAAFALEDARVESIRVRVEKLDAIREAASVGVEIERQRNRN